MRNTGRPTGPQKASRGWIRRPCRPARTPAGLGYSPADRGSRAPGSTRRPSRSRSRKTGRPPQRANRSQTRYCWVEAYESLILARFLNQTLVPSLLSTASTFTPWGFCLTMVQGAGQAISENKISDKIILPRQSPGLTRCLGCPWHHSLRCPLLRIAKSRCVERALAGARQSHDRSDKVIRYRKRSVT